MYEEHALSLSEDLNQRIRKAIEDVNTEGDHRTAPNRFNHDITVTERNAFTKAVVKEVAWLNSRDGRKRAAEEDHHFQCVLYDLIEIALAKAIESNMSPLQVLYGGIWRAMGPRFCPDDLKVVADFVATVLAEGVRQHRDKMFSVTFEKIENRKIEKKIDHWLNELESEYWWDGDFGKEVSGVLFVRNEDATNFRFLLQELQVKKVDFV